MNIEDRIIDLLNEEFEGKPKGFKALSEYKFRDRNVPRVTVILTEMQSDQGLIRYANYLGFKHIDYNQMLNNASVIGKETHSFIESYIQKNEGYKAPVRQEVVNCTNAFMDWWKMLNYQCRVEVLGEEQPLTCPWFGGTYDLLLKVDGKVCLVDFKTSNHITHRYFIQLAAYRYLISFNYSMHIDMLMVLRLCKENGQYEMVTVDLSIPEDYEFIEHCTYAFFSQVNNYYSLARVKHDFNRLMKGSRETVNVPEDPNEEIKESDINVEPTE